MSTREEVEALVREVVWAGDDNAHLTDSQLDERTKSYANRVMSIPALRLAEKAEENKDWKLAVVDNGLQAMAFTHEVGDLEIEHVFRHAKDYRKVIEVAQ